MGKRASQEGLTNTFFLRKSRENLCNLVVNIKEDNEQRD